LLLERFAKACTFTRQDLRELRRKIKPWMLLSGAFVCVVLTALVKIGLSAREGRTSAVARAEALQPPDAESPKLGPLAAVEVVNPAAPNSLAKSQPKPEPKKDRRTLPVEELQALKTGKELAVDPKEQQVRLPDPLMGLADPAGAPVPPNAAAAGANAAPPVRDPLGAQNGARARRNRVNVRKGGPNAKDPLVAGRAVAKRQLPANVRVRGPFAAERPVFGQPPDNNLQGFTRDPDTGAFFSADKQWRVPNRYYLPIDTPDIARARMVLAAIDPAIELQWWFPRRVEIRSEHYKGRIAKLRFLAPVLKDQVQKLDQVRVVGSRGENEGGWLLLEVEAFFYLHDIGGPHKHRIGFEDWRLIPASVDVNPDWFRDDKLTIKRGEVGPLPVKGPDIDAVRKAIGRVEEEGEIREVKWWPPRVNPDDNHRMSKLRYEVLRDGDVRLAEIEFDYKVDGVGYPRLAINLFPEDDRHAVSIEPAQK
jgi:hypothetical protein